MPEDRASERGGFCSWPRPELRTKRIRGSILLPGRISSKRPASMRDASDLRHLILRRCPRFTSGPPGAPPLIASYTIVTPRLRDFCVRVLFPFFFLLLFFLLSALGSHPPPRCHMCSTCDHVVVVSRRSVVTQVYSKGLSKLFVFTYAKRSYERVSIDELLYSDSAPWETHSTSVTIFSLRI